jgi:lysophospholipase L1-like esterase
MNANQRNIMKQTLLFVSAWLAISPASLQAAELRIASVCSSQMVLQREKPVSVWGWTEPGEAVTVEFAGQKKAATADAAGRWLVTLDPMPANAQPRELLVTSANPKAKPQDLKVPGVLVGDVWLCAGGNEVGRRGTEADAAPDDAQTPPVRVFSVTPSTAREPQTDLKGRWTAVQKATLKQLPAQACILGRALATELRVPVGIISVSNVIPTSPRYLTNCRAFNAAAEAVMRELHVPVTDIHGLIQPRITELISSDLIHTNKEADEMMADLIAQRLTETLAALPHRKP